MDRNCCKLVKLPIVSFLLCYITEIGQLCTGSCSNASRPGTSSTEYHTARLVPCTSSDQHERNLYRVPHYLYSYSTTSSNNMRGISTEYHNICTPSTTSSDQHERNLYRVPHYLYSYSTTSSDNMRGISTEYHTIYTPSTTSSSQD